MGTVLEGNNIVGMTLQSGNLLPCHQVPHLAASVCRGRDPRTGKGTLVRVSANKLLAQDLPLSSVQAGSDPGHQELSGAEYAILVHIHMT